MPLLFNRTSPTILQVLRPKGRKSELLGFIRYNNPTIFTAYVPLDHKAGQENLVLTMSEMCEILARSTFAIGELAPGKKDEAVARVTFLTKTALKLSALPHRLYGRMVPFS